MLWGGMVGGTEETRREETRALGRGGRGTCDEGARMRKEQSRGGSAAPIREIRDGNFIH